MNKVFLDIEEARLEFPGTQDKTFLDAASVSLAPTRTKKSLMKFTENAINYPEQSSGNHYMAMEQQRKKAYAEAALLFNAGEDEIGLIESTSHGLNIAATAMKLSPGSNILISELEFLQVPIPWMMQAGINIKLIPSRQGRVLAKDFEAAMDRNTGAIVISSVQWCNGYRIDLEAFGEMAKKHNIYLVIDAAQQAGACAINVRNTHAHFLVAGGHKWLNSPFGAGIMYINKSLIDKIDPVYWGYHNIEAPPGGWLAHFSTPDTSPISDWKFIASAKRFEIGGTSNYPGAIALGESLSLINEIGITNIEKHIFKLTAYLMNGLRDLGAYLISVPDPDARSGIVTFRLYQDIEEEKLVLEKLHKQNVFVSLRFTSNIGGIRASCHFYNNYKDMDKLTKELGKIISVKKPDFRGDYVN